MIEPAGLDATAYLERIGHRGPVPPTPATLRALHLAHLRTVPFENLDVHSGRPIRLDEGALFEKIVGRRRGGFCYELNGLFAGLLHAVGFEVSLLAAQFPREEGRTAPPFDHLTLLVRTPGGDGSWLADVGAGRGSFATPLPAETDDEAWQPEACAAFRLAWEGERRRLWRREADGAWEREYAFTTRPHALGDFAAGCLFHQTSPDSVFTRGRICSLATPTGRVTLADRRLIVTEEGRRTERELTEVETRAALRSRFGIDPDR